MEETSYLFDSCDLVVLPYTDASNSGPLMLAYSFGKPVIVTNVGNLAEYVADKENGFVIPPNNL